MTDTTVGTLTAMANDLVTPSDLECELDVPAKRIRVILRAEYGLLAERGDTRWELNEEQVAHVRHALGRG